MTAPDDEPQEAQAEGRNPALSFGINFAGGMALFAGIGYWLDQKYGSEPWCTLGGAMLGLGYGGWELRKILRWIKREDEKRPKGEMKPIPYEDDDWDDWKRKPGND